MKKIDDDKVPRVPIRKEGDNKSKLLCKDIFTYYNLLDKENVSLPCFLTENLEHIPALKKTDVNAVSMFNSIGEMRSAIDNLTAEVAALKLAHPSAAVTSDVNTKSAEETKRK